MFINHILNNIIGQKISSLSTFELQFLLFRIQSVQLKYNHFLPLLLLKLHYVMGDLEQKGHRVTHKGQCYKPKLNTNNF